jgi:hypothetical protein
VVQNPFDLVIFDHVTHFSPDGLARLGRSVFGEALHVSTAWNPKEVSMLAGAGIGRSEPWASARPAPFGLVDMVNWLKSVVADARAARRNGTRLGIFGTSIAGTWLAAALDAFDFFVDEDEARIGHSYMGRPVLHPADARGPVYVPFGPEMARGIANRLSSLGIDSVVPGPLAGLDRCQ